MKTILTLLVLLSTFLFADKGDFEKVTLQLQWKHQFQFAGYYIAKEKEFYKQAGLDVEIVEFENSIDVVSRVMNNKATYGTGRPSLIIDKSNNIDVVLLSAIFQSSPHIILATKNSGIKSIKDFKNKRFMSTGDAKNDAAVISMMFSQKIELSNLKLQKPSFDVNDLINDNTDLMSSYISNEPFKLKELGGVPIIFDPKDYGFEFYSDLLFTSKEETRNHPYRVKRFNKATLKGWEYAFDNMEEAVDLIFEKYNTQNKTRAALLYEAKKLKELAYYKTDQIGTLKIEKIEKIYDVYNLMGLVKNKIDFEGMLLDNSFLNEQELRFLDENSFNIYINNWSPFSFYNSEKNQFSGLSKDYWDKIIKHIPISYKLHFYDNFADLIKNAKQDKQGLLLSLSSTKERKEYGSFSKPYVKYPIAVATNEKENFITDFKELEGKTIAVGKNFSAHKLLQKHYPKIKFVPVKNTVEALELLAQGKVFGAADILLSLQHYLQTHSYTDIKISGTSKFTFNVSIMVNKANEKLIPILNKAIDKITEDDKKNIQNKWISVKYHKGAIDYSLVFKILGVFLVVVIIFVVYIRKLHKLQKKLDISHKSLEKLIDTQDNIIILTDGENLNFANKSFFEFLGYENLEQFKEKFNCICDKFMENDQFFHMGKLEKDESWIEHLLKLPHSERIVGILRHDFSIQAFSLSINKFDDEQYIISFANITQTILCNLELQDKSIRDKLTNAFNREYFEQNYKQIIKDTEKSGSQLALAFLDIDHFKAVNDTYGHDVGDNVLIEFVEIVNKFSRDNDIIIRWGGEEFILLLRVKSEQGLYKALEHLRRVIELQEFPIVGQKTCSMGGTIYNDGEEIESTIKRADIGVYEAKENGRNMVVIK